MKYLATALIGLLLVVGCTDTKSRNSNFLSFNEDDVSEVVEMEEMPITQRIASRSNFKKTQAKLIKTSRLRFETKSIENTFVSINNQILALKGYIQLDETNKSYNRITRHLVVRVPKDAFQTIIDSIATSVKYFDLKQIKLKDVTEEFIDATARLNTKKKLEKRYLALLQKANTVKEMLSIERELSKIREEIDAKQGRLNYLNNKINLSTINITFYEKIKPKPSEKQSYLSRIKKALNNGFESIGNTVVGIFSIWPLLIIGFLVYLWIIKRLRRKKTK